MRSISLSQVKPIAMSRRIFVTTGEDLDVAKDAWAIVAPDNALSGYGTLTVEAETGRIFADGYVHPLHYGRGIGTTLIALMEARAAELVPTLPEEIRIVLVNNIIATSEPGRSLLERHGYGLNRVYFRMHITLDEPPQPPIMAGRHQRARLRWQRGRYPSGLRNHRGGVQRSLGAHSAQLRGLAALAGTRGF